MRKEIREIAEKVMQGDTVYVDADVHGVSQSVTVRYFKNKEEVYDDSIGYIRFVPEDDNSLRIPVLNATYAEDIIFEYFVLQLEATELYYTVRGV